MVVVVRKVTGFEFGMVFPSDDLVSEWMVTLAVISNDLALVHAQAEEDYDTPHKFFYWVWIGTAHYNEAGKYLDDASDVEEGKDFIATLPDEAQERYAECLSVYREHSATLEQLRSVTAFHYGSLKAGREKRPVRTTLDSLAGEIGRVDMGTTGKIKDSRLLFADDVMARMFVGSSGGEKTPPGSPPQSARTTCAGR